MNKKSSLIVSIGIVAYNEERSLPALLDDIKKQDYPHENIEVVLIDSCSTDTTKKIMLEFQKAQSEFWNIQVLDNPRKKQASGWNVAIENFKGDALSRIDAHASITPNFISENVKLLNEGEYVTGGPRPNIIDDSSAWKETLLMAEQSMFGSSIAKYRRNGEKEYVNSLFHGTYRREVFAQVGKFNEQLGRTEDNEFHYRIRKRGYKICFSPEVLSYQHARNTLKGMLKQKYGNGYWVVLTLKVCPQCLSVFHFVPFAFVMAIIGTSLLSVCGISILAKIMWGMYGFLAILMSLIAIKGNKKCIQQMLLPVLFFLLHISYGIGSVVGFLKLPFWLNEYQQGIGMKEQ